MVLINYLLSRKRFSCNLSRPIQVYIEFLDTPLTLCPFKYCQAAVPPFFLFQRLCDQQQLELQGNAEVLRRQLDVAREQLCKAEEEKACLQGLLEKKAQEGRKSQEFLRKKDEELNIRQEEIQKVINPWKCVYCWDWGDFVKTQAMIW